MRNIPLERYLVDGLDDVITPALVIYPEIVAANIDAMLRIMRGDANRWRPHVKTSKLGYVMRQMADKGVVNVKCSTTLELATACAAGARDVLVAYAMTGANARRVRELAAENPGVRVSVLVENASQLAAWSGSGVGIFIDVNSGMNRTGVDQARTGEIVSIAGVAGPQFRGLHWYDGHVSDADLAKRERDAHTGYARLLDVVRAVEDAGLRVGEVVTSGTPAFPAGLSFDPFSSGAFVHRVSPGTVVYNDFVSLAQLPGDYGFQPAALIVARVVSHPLPNTVTCDAGHKSVSADAGVPTCQVVGRPELIPLKPSEEHLPIEVPRGAAPPHIGDLLYLLPRHVCPSVNNFDEAILAIGGRIAGIERVTARGHESPLPVAARTTGR
jgi:D-serine deaminase-like pyridoxal phosphate-dependent protein